MIIKNLLEIHQVMWKDHCDIIAAKNELTYEGRQRDDIHSLCIYLKQNPSELLEKDLHYLDHDKKFFLKSPFDNVIMWKRRVETCINNKSRVVISRPQSKNSIKRHFRVTRKRKRRGRPKLKTKKNLMVQQKERTKLNQPN